MHDGSQGKAIADLSNFELGFYEFMIRHGWCTIEADAGAAGALERIAIERTARRRK